jgi:hypothetical protein
MFWALKGHLQDANNNNWNIFFRNSVDDIPGLSTDPECLHLPEREILPSSEVSLSLLNVCYGRSGNEYCWFIIFVLLCIDIYGFKVEIWNIKYVSCKWLSIGGWTILK